MENIFLNTTIHINKLYILSFYHGSIRNNGCFKYYWARSTLSIRNKLAKILEPNK